MLSVGAHRTVRDGQAHVVAESPRPILYVEVVSGRRVKDATVPARKLHSVATQLITQPMYSSRGLSARSACEAHPVPMILKILSCGWHGHGGRKARALASKWSLTPTIDVYLLPPTYTTTSLPSARHPACHQLKPGANKHTHRQRAIHDRRALPLPLTTTLCRHVLSRQQRQRSFGVATC